MFRKLSVASLTALAACCFSPVGPEGSTSSGTSGGSAGTSSSGGTAASSGGSGSGGIGGSSGGASSGGGSNGGSTGSTGVSCAPGAVDACTTIQPPTGDSVYCDYATTPCPNDASVGTATPGVCAVYSSDGNSSCQSDADCGPYDVCGAQGTCTGFACPAQPIECPTGCNFESVPHTCGACVCTVCPSGTGGSSTGGGSTGGGSTGGTGGGCTADDQCSANLPSGFSIYCDYGSAYCSSGTVVETPGSCVVYQTGATNCTTSLDCDPDQFCSLPPGCVGGSGCQGTCQDLVCGTGQTCPAECPLQNYPHACAACTCPVCGGSGSDGGVGDAGCTSDVQCQAPFASYCDFTVEACGQPLGQFVEVPGSCEPNASASSCASDADCSEQDYCFNPTGACATCGTCQPVVCNQPPQQCFQGCALTSVPHQCPACICPASSCCLLCN